MSRRGKDGLIHPTRSGRAQGISVNTDPSDKFIQQYGGAFTRWLRAQRIGDNSVGPTWALRHFTEVSDELRGLSGLVGSSGASQLQQDSLNYEEGDFT